MSHPTLADFKGTAERRARIADARAFGLGLPLITP